MKSLNSYFVGFGLLVMAGALAVGFIDNEVMGSFFSNQVNWILITFAVFLLIAFIAVFRALEAMKYMVLKKEGRLPQEAEEDWSEEEGGKSWVDNLLAKLQDSKPVDEEDEIELDHNYDGIRELDNNLPPWWLYGFYITIIFAVIYLVRYHVTGSAPLPLEEYEMEMAAAAAQKEEYLKNAANLVDENTVELLTAEPRIANGKAIFTKNCAVCHAQDGGGGVGPNLTDPYWIHGGSISDVFGTIKYGVPSKGMISWKDQLSPKDIQDVSSFILTLQGTTPADTKEPQGDLDEPGAAAPDTLNTDSDQSEEGREKTETAEL